MAPRHIDVRYAHAYLYRHPRLLALAGSLRGRGFHIQPYVRPVRVQFHPTYTFRDSHRLLCESAHNVRNEQAFMSAEPPNRQTELSELGRSRPSHCESMQDVVLL